MAGGQALRVPISILHGLVYPGGGRLAKLVPLEKKKPTAPATRSIDCDDDFLFKRTPYLRRYFITLNQLDETECRACGGKSASPEGRRRHNECYGIVCRALAAFENGEKCIVCEEPIATTTRWRAEFQAVPVCSVDCLDLWDWYNPVHFQSVLDEVLKNENYRKIAEKARYGAN